jgi:predicted cupin superfamily sugar epimerase
MDAKSWVESLQLEPHPEGGFFRETFRDSRTEHDGRSVSTAIYFLLPKGSVSRLHRIDSSEVWHFYAGGPLQIVELDEQGHVRTTMLGTALDKGETLQYVVPPGRWFGAIPAAGTEYALVGCTVAPGFLYEKFEMAEREVLLEQFPAAQEWIAKLTPK